MSSGKLREEVAVSFAEDRKFLEIAFGPERASKGHWTQISEPEPVRYELWAGGRWRTAIGTNLEEMQGSLHFRYEVGCSTCYVFGITFVTEL